MSYSYAKGGQSGVPAHAPGPYVLSRKIDLAVASKALKGAAFANTDVIEALNIPAGTLVKRVGVIVHKAEGAACTVGIGDGAAATGFLAAVDLNALGHTFSALKLTEGAPNTVTGSTGGKLYAAADTIDVTCNSAGTDAAVFTVWAECLDLNF